jgi:hypothetical protein
MLPRIVVAVILINLSIYIVAALEDLFNILGAGLFDLIKAPFGAAWVLNLGGITSSIFDVLLVGFGGATVLGGGLAAVLGGAGLISSVGLWLVLAVVLPVFLAIISVLFTLLFRQGLLVLLVMTSPVAFALYCLPNTESLFRRWWSLLIRTLVVYPVVVCIIAISQVLGIVFTH